MLPESPKLKRFGARPTWGWECSHTQKRPIEKMGTYICRSCRKVLDNKTATHIVAAFEMFPAKQAEALFVADEPNGYYELSCSHCQHVAVYSDHLSDWVCRQCKYILVYPEGASW